MAEIHAPVIAADINDDGKIEMVTTDSHGNVALSFLLFISES